MARFYAALVGEVDGVRVLKSETVELGRREVRRGVEPFWGSEMAYAAGFELRSVSLVRYQFGGGSDGVP
jgi:hypothetical protein